MLVCFQLYDPRLLQCHVVRTWPPTYCAAKNILSCPRFVQIVAQQDTLPWRTCRQRVVRAVRYLQSMLLDSAAVNFREGSGVLDAPQALTETRGEGHELALVGHPVKNVLNPQFHPYFVQAAQLRPVGGGGTPRSRTHKRRLLQPIRCVGGAAAQYAGGPAAHRRLCAPGKLRKAFFRFAGGFPFLALHLRHQRPLCRRPRSPPVAARPRLVPFMS